MAGATNPLLHSLRKPNPSPGITTRKPRGLPNLIIWTRPNSIAVINNAETIILLALCDSSNLLNKIFERKKIRSRKKRIKQIVNGEIIGQATREVIESVQAAIAVAAIMPAIMASTTAATR